MIKDDCLFCQIGQHNEPAEIIIEDKNYIVIENKFPKAKVHILVMPKKHKVFEKLQKDDKNVLGDLLLLCNKAAKKKGIHRSGFRVIINSGEDSMRHFEHIHIHVMGGEKMGDIV